MWNGRVIQQLKFIMVFDQFINPDAYYKARKASITSFSSNILGEVRGAFKIFFAVNSNLDKSRIHVDISFCFCILYSYSKDIWANYHLPYLDFVWWTQKDRSKWVKVSKIVKPGSQYAWARDLPHAIRVRLPWVSCSPSRCVIGCHSKNVTCYMTYFVSYHCFSATSGYKQEGQVNRNYTFDDSVESSKALDTVYARFF